jgi:hypothetical protein
MNDDERRITTKLDPELQPGNAMSGGSRLPSGSQGRSLAGSAFRGRSLGTREKAGASEREMMRI